MAKHTNGPKCPKCQEMIYAFELDGTLRVWFENLQAEQNDVHMAHTYRDKPTQDRMLKEKLSKASFGKSPHNYLPARAIDLFFLKNDKYDLDINRLEAIADASPDEIMWGGWFKSFSDKPHFERKDWKVVVKNYPKGNTPDGTS